MIHMRALVLVVLSVLAGCRSTNPRGECLFKLLHRGDFTAAEAFLAKHPARINGEYCDMRDVDDSLCFSWDDCIKHAKCSFAEGRPLLYLFADKPKIIKWLLDHGARIDRQRPILWRSVSHVATLPSITLMIEAVRKIGPLDIILNSEDNVRMTVLNWAIRCKNYPVAEYLMRSGADINHINSAGWTPLDAVVKELNIIKKVEKYPNRQKRITELKDAETWIRQHGGKFAIELTMERVKESDKEDELLRKRLSKYLSQKDVDRILGNNP